MNQYQYQFSADDSIDPDEIKAALVKMYTSKKWKELAFESEQDLPFLIILSKSNSTVIVRMTSRSKKNIERMESIHAKIKKPFTINNIEFQPPQLVVNEQCKWWDTDCSLKSDEKWQTLVHKGPYFGHLMEPYVPANLSIIYDGKRYKLTPEEEKIALFYARRIISENSGNVAQIWTKDAVFNKNFFNDFKEYLSPEHAKIFKIFAKFDFTPLVEHLTELKEGTVLSDSDKKHKKIATAEKKEEYGFAIINGNKEPIGNFTVEPAAIFMGRGENPLRGKIKKDIFPENVTINIDSEENVPEPPAGHAWGNIVHDKTAAWIASWKDPISNENKYVYLSAEGQLKGKSDLVKYEKARKLNKHIEMVREKYMNDAKSKSIDTMQLGTVLYLIDNFGIRVGNEKDETEADTVGASTLRVEHVKTRDPDIIIFDFLGKDSIRFYKELQVDGQIFENIKKLIARKKPDEMVFDKISASDINNYLKNFDKDFSAKVFRTRLASTIMDNALKNIKIKKTNTSDEKKKLFIKANAQVADVLNHQKSISTKAQEQLKNIKEEIKELKKEIKQAKADGKSTKSLETRLNKKKDQVETKNDTASVAVTTSLTNYIDPRLVVSWIKKNDLPEAKVYTATLQRKFKWAIDMTDADWDYTDTELLREMSELEPVTDTAKTIVTTPKPKKLTTPAPTTPKSTFTPTSDTFKKTLIKQIDDIKIIQYSEKSIFIIGDTKSISEQIKNTLNGKWIPGTINGKKIYGWIVAIKHLDKVLNILGEEPETPPTPPTPLLPGTPPMLVSSANNIFNVNAHTSEYLMLSKYYKGVELMLRMAILNSLNLSDAELKKLTSSVPTKAYLDNLLSKFDIQYFLTQWYELYAPEKLSEINSIMDKYNDNEAILFEKLYKKYIDQDAEPQLLWFGKTTMDATLEKNDKAMAATPIDIFDVAKYIDIYELCAEYYGYNVEQYLRAALLINARNKLATQEERVEFDKKMKSKTSGRNFINAVTKNVDKRFLLIKWLQHYKPDQLGRVTEFMNMYDTCMDVLFYYLYAQVDNSAKYMPLWFSRCEKKMAIVIKHLGSKNVLDPEIISVKLTREEKHTILCFASNHNVVNYIKRECIDPNTVFDTEFIIKFLECLGRIGAIEYEQYSKFTRSQLNNVLANILAPNHLYTIIFLVYILKQVKDPNYYLKKLLLRAQDGGIDKCLQELNE